MTALFAINLAENNLSGQIPGAFGQLTRLNHVYIQNNQFNGSLDSIFCSQDQLLSLQNIEADCKGSTPEIECTCCTLCCDADGVDCTSPTSTPVAMPTLSPVLGKARFDQLIGILQPISGLFPFTETTSPQYKAAWWLATTDGLQLDFSTETSDKIVQRYVLALLWYTFGGESWDNRKNYVTDLLTCLWDDVSCDDNGLVIEIDLQDNNLVGWMPSEIGFFPNLQTLVLGMYICRLLHQINPIVASPLILLDGNGITGNLPSTLFQMTKLQILSIHDNLLSGEIPTQIGQLGLCEVLDLCKSGLLLIMYTYNSRSLINYLDQQITISLDRCPLI